MFDPQQAVLGLPAQVVTLAVAFVLMVVGALWLRRITSGEPEMQSFWATARPRRNLPLTAGLVLAAVAVVLTVALSL